MHDQELLEIFLQEAAELMGDLEDGLVSLEQRPEDSELLNRVFRAAHTIKGNAGLTGCDQIVDFTHTVEGVLEQLRSGQIQVSGPLVTALLGSVDVLQAMVEAVGRGTQVDPPADGKGVIASLRQYMVDSDAAPLPEAPLRSYDIRINLRPDIFETGQDPAALIEELLDFGTLRRVDADISRLPPLGDDFNPIELYLSWRVVLETRWTRSAIENVFVFVAEDDDNDIKISEMGVEATRLPSGEIDPSTDPLQAAKQVERATSIRVDTDKLDTLVNLVGELVIGVARVTQTVLDETCETDDRSGAVEALDRISRDLQAQVMCVRMVPVAGTFNRFKRVVRDMADELGKRVELRTEGIETELDKNVIEQLFDPLKHLIRNGLDHGIEPPSEREAAGKHPVGTVQLRAIQREGSIIIEVADDGRGIDRARVHAQAMAHGLIDDSVDLDDKRLLDLLFEPGFSTARAVTALSGRGVGLDVVRRNIEDLRGAVELQSQPGLGACFRIRLPLTLAIIEGMKIQVGGEIFVVPLLNVIEQIRPRRRDVKTLDGRGEIVVVRNEYLPLIRLHDLFGLDTERVAPWEALVMVLDNEGRKYCVLVDDVLGQEQAVIKALDRNFRKVDGIAGATILGDGRVSLIIDVTGMERMAFG